MRRITKGSAGSSRRAYGPVVFMFSILVLAACSEKIMPAGTSAQAVASTGDAATPETQRTAADRADTAAVDAIVGTKDPVLRRGKELFAKQCAICHGDAGDGTGKFAYLMNPRPRNFQQGNFKLATTQNQIPSDDDLLRTISRGMPGSAMPPWGHLPLTDLQALVAYVRKIHYDAAKVELERGTAEGKYASGDVADLLAKRTQPGAPIVVSPEPPFDDLRWFTGRRIYLEACASCHGVDGQPVADAVKFDAEGYPVPPRSFVNGVFKGGSEGHQLYARIIKGLKGTPMPSSEGNYTSDEVWDLIHYVQSLARTGAQERALLRQGTFVAPNSHASLPTGPMDPAWSQARPLYVGMTPLWWT
ncbi:MAG: cytochrome c, partial [Planctomycetota bacterium]